MKLFNIKIINKCFDEANASEKFCLYGGVYDGYYTSFEYFLNENLKEQKKKFSFKRSK